VRFYTALVFSFAAKRGEREEREEREDVTRRDSTRERGKTRPRGRTEQQEGTKLLKKLDLGILIFLFTRNKN